jgi:hypothetical protein
MNEQVRWYLLRTSAAGVVVSALGMVWPSPSDSVRVGLFGALALIGWVMFGVLWIVLPGGPPAVEGGVE